jgi:uncharacterized membrane protein YuzA (DUF378 family)
MLDELRDLLAVSAVIIIGVFIFGLITRALFGWQGAKSMLVYIMIGIANLVAPWLLFTGIYLKFSDPIPRMLGFLLFLGGSIGLTLLMTKVQEYDEKEKKVIIRIRYARWAFIFFCLSLWVLTVFFIQSVWIP